MEFETYIEHQPVLLNGAGSADWRSTMDRVDVTYAREHLPELIERAARGEAIAIVDPAHGIFDLKPARDTESRDDLRIGPPILGQWSGRLTVPARLFEPLTDEELAWLSGESSQ